MKKKILCGFILSAALAAAPVLYAEIPEIPRKAGEYDLKENKDGVFEYNVTRFIKGPGTYELRFPRSGGCALKIKGAELLENKKMVAADQHEGTLGMLGTDSTYFLRLEQTNPKADYVLKCRLEGIGGQDAFGRVVMIRRPLLDKIGSWSKETFKRNPAVVEFDVTRFIKKSGVYEVRFCYTKGYQAVGISSVTLIKNGQTQFTDKHKGTSGLADSDNVYTMKANYTPGAKYMIRAVINGEGGTDTNGNAWINVVD